MLKALCIAVFLSPSWAIAGETVISLPDLEARATSLIGTQVTIIGARLWGATRNEGKPVGFAWIYDGSGKTAMAILDPDKSASDRKLFERCTSPVPRAVVGCIGSITGMVTVVSADGTPTLDYIKLVE